MPTIAVSFLLLAALAAAPPATTRAGMTYRVEGGEGASTVWVSGADARQEFEAVEGLPPRGSMIWKDGGRTILVVNDHDQTYYDELKYRPREKGGEPMLSTMSASKPFEVAGVKKVRVDVRPGTAETAEGCSPVSVAFSYELQLRIEQVPGTIPGQVEGTAELCMTDAFPVDPIPFEHGTLPRTGIEGVDKVLAERLAGFTGTVVRQKVTATRHIENGQAVTKSAAQQLTGAKPATIPLARFEVPAGYRYQEPVIIGPSRQQQ